MRAELHPIPACLPKLAAAPCAAAPTSLPRRFAQLPQTVAGFVFDSAPAFMYPGKPGWMEGIHAQCWLRALGLKWLLLLTHPPPQGPGPPPPPPTPTPLILAAGALQRVVHSIEPPGLLRSLKAAYYSAATAAERLRWGPTRAEAFWEHMQALSWGRPLLYLYSCDDLLAHGARITELVAEKRRRGQDVQARCWDCSEHVGHLRRHREEYTRLLLGHLARCEASVRGSSSHEQRQGGGSSGGGSSGSGGGQVAGPLPHARL